MQPDQAIIDRFYKGECTSGEAKLVMDWLLLNGEDLSEEWKETSSVGEYPQEYPAEMLDFIQKVNARAFPGKRVFMDSPYGKKVFIRSIPWRRAMVAAGILLVVGISVVFWDSPKRKGETKASLAVRPQMQQKQAVSVSGFTAVNGPASGQSTIRFADGSTAILSPGTVLLYDSLAYGQKDRVVYLTGQAVFSVATKKDRPFRVNANGFSTTALGTSFMVSTKSQHVTRVRLYSGKVLIRHTDPSAAPMQDIYLQPGEEMVYNENGQRSLVSRFEPLNAKRSLAMQKRRDIRLSGDTLVFDNAPLADVLDLLHRRYHVAIQYERSILSDAYFTGQILPGDAIELILKTVTRINKLTLIAANDGFIIR